MAREMYLVGVPEEELQQKPEAPKPPKTFCSWLDNFWYHHKIGVLVGGFTLFVLAVIITQMFTRERPDYTVVLVTETACLSEEVTYFEQALVPYAQDVNGDGEVIIQVGNLFLGGKQYAYQDTNAQALQMRLISGDTLLYIYEPQYEERLTKVGKDGAHCFLTQLPIEAQGISEHRLCWVWGQDERRRDDPVLSKFPDSLCFGVRYANANDESSAAMYEQCVALVKAIALDQKTAKK